jgi:hypothetical protein
VSGLVACPFCRELFESSEADDCPECDVRLVPLSRLPPSYDEVEREVVDWERGDPADEPRAWLDLRDGRGLSLALSACGLLAFALAPWVDVTSPHAEWRSGYSLARGPLAWLWGGAIGWLTCIGIVASRRSRRQLWGVRAITALMSSLSFAEALMLVLLTPDEPRLVPFRYEWAWGLYVSLALSAAGVAAALRLGGSAPAPDAASVAPVQTARARHTVH